MPRPSTVSHVAAGAQTEGNVIRDSAGDSGGVAVPRRAAIRCGWCGRQLEAQEGTGRRRKYCGQSCRQRAYENRNALTRHELPADAVVMSAAERDALADRLFQMLCAAEDVATALQESASRAELGALVDALLEAAHAAERLR